MLGKRIRLVYIDVALGLAAVNVSGLVGCMSKRKCWRMDPKRPRPRPRGSIAKGKKILFWSRMSPMTVSPVVVMPVVGWFCCRVRSFFFSYFRGCESALAIKILVTSLEVGSKIGQGVGQLMVKPMVVYEHA